MLFNCFFLIDEIVFITKVKNKCYCYFSYVGQQFINAILPFSCLKGNDLNNCNVYCFTQVWWLVITKRVMAFQTHSVIMTTLKHQTLITLILLRLKSLNAFYFVNQILTSLNIVYQIQSAVLTFI